MEHDALTNPFIPLFGEVPYSLAGRRDEIKRIERAFESPGNDPYRFTLITGPRGSGKTSLLTFAAKTAEQHGWIAVNSYAVPGMLEVLYDQARLNVEHIVSTSERPHLSSITAGPVGLSWDHPIGAQESWHTRMTRLLLLLAEKGVGLLFTLDEVRADLDEVIVLASSCQIFLRENFKIALYIAGLPRDTSQLITHESTSFLRRAMQFKLGSVADYEAELALEKTIYAGGKTIEPEALRYAAKATGGYPFLIQLVGYRIWEWGEDHEVLTMKDAEKGIGYALREFDDRILAPSFYEMSAGDRAFAKAMLQDEEYSTISDIAKRIGRSNSYTAQYKRRLLEQGVIEENYDKSVRFSLPGMREFVAAHV